jgi:protein-L-isoaspartate O-methyltransferase
MMMFHPSHPFPLLDEGAYSYAESQANAETADKWLGLQTSKVESVLSERGCFSRAPNANQDHQQLWIGLATQNLLTPYLEIRRILKLLNPQPGQLIADLGAAYGRMAFVVGHHYPNVHFVGYEFVGERLKEGARCLTRLGYKNVRMQHADLSSKDFAPAEADYYFIYDYGKPKAIEKTLYDLRRIAELKSIRVVARGKACQSAIASRHSWLKKIQNSESSGRSSIYRSSIRALE